MRFSRTIFFLVILFATAAGFFGGFLSLFIFSTFSPLSLLIREDSSSFSSSMNPALIGLIEEESATIEVVEELRPSVVSILVKKQASDLSFEDPFLFFNDRLGESKNDEWITVGGGTGFFVTSGGLLVTNKHVVDQENAQFVIVTDDDIEFSATLVAKDPFFDIALLQVEGNTFLPVRFGDSRHLRVGQTVIAIGNSLSEFRNTVTKGVISGVHRSVQAGTDLYDTEWIEEAIQTDAAINPGNSGGPLINLFGEVIGMNTAISSQGQGIGFAIPSENIQAVVNDMNTMGRIVYPWLGVRFVMLDEMMAKELDLSVSQGALLVSGDKENEVAVISESPADEAGLLKGDIILSVNDQVLDIRNTLAKVIRAFEPGVEVVLTIKRGQDLLTITVQLAEYQP
ncbi:hypothetical protein CO172_03580 [Candidatus Uhrbacteria bacterium CG_4_9_14_3_um_filter_36_7]|uniref:PDZ domain-containing protein n=1 Tax=Candidatus Uhrbacteria bacterium CG_4_9_14_3_um_filter_36_7 TaxID=1975033 RepID=A0A2M7XFX4_9BACT|nr:MAG: hypothetical protein CO172_03580 [Candidatus Uhrbacteria bacterium CG_4_9_14_3_um_filter_36_7]